MDETPSVCSAIVEAWVKGVRMGKQDILYRNLSLTGRPIVRRVILHLWYWVRSDDMWMVPIRRGGGGC